MELVQSAQRARAVSRSALSSYASSQALKSSERDNPDRALLSNAVEEVLRLEPAAAVVDRYATRAVELGGAFIEEGNTSPGGKLPMNTNGGGLSYTHTGMYGMFAMQESVRPVRGEAAHQVPDVQVSFCQGVGGMFMAAGSLIFTNQPP